MCPTLEGTPSGPDSSSSMSSPGGSLVPVGLSLAKQSSSRKVGSTGRGYPVPNNGPQSYHTSRQMSRNSSPAPIPCLSGILTPHGTSTKGALLWHFPTPQVKHAPLHERPSARQPHSPLSIDMRCRSVNGKTPRSFNTPNNTGEPWLRESSSSSSVIPMHNSNPHFMSFTSKEP